MVKARQNWRQPSRAQKLFLKISISKSIAYQIQLWTQNSKWERKKDLNHKSSIRFTTDFTSLKSKTGTHNYKTVMTSPLCIRCPRWLILIGVIRIVKPKFNWSRLPPDRVIIFWKANITRWSKIIFQEHKTSHQMSRIHFNLSLLIK